MSLLGSYSLVNFKKNGRQCVILKNRPREASCQLWFALHFPQMNSIYLGVLFPRTTVFAVVKLVKCYPIIGDQRCLALATNFGDLYGKF